MPVHDWSKAPPGFFHHFHQQWSGAICDGLNDGRLPSGYFALIEQHTVGLVPDVLTLQREADTAARAGNGRTHPTGSGAGGDGGGGLAVADAPPRARFVSRVEEELYVAKANRVVVRATGGRVVAVIGIVSPGNKSSQHTLRSFVEKTVDLLFQDVNLLVVDLLPPGPRDPLGIHPLIWSAVREEPFALPPDKPLTLAAYAAGPPRTAYVEPVAPGDPLPDMPAFLDAATYVPVPLGPTYEETWSRCPREFRELVLMQRDSTATGEVPG